MKNILKQWDECNLIKIFEIGVLDKRTNKLEYIIFDLSIEGDKFIAQHEGLSQSELDSDKIAFKSIDIDPDLSLDANLQELYGECIEAICTSEFYELPIN